MDPQTPQSRKYKPTSAYFKILNAIQQKQDASRDQELQLQLRNRQKAINEIISSEESYLHQLDVLKEFFLEPIVFKVLMPAREIVPIYSDLETILQVNTTLLHRLKEERDCKSVGQAFIELAPYLKLYSSFANKFEQTCATVQKYQTERKEFASFMLEQESRTEVNAKFQSLLITPVQRVPRYKLLLEKVLENTPRESSDYLRIEAALIEISIVATHINDHIRDKENVQKMLSIQKRLSGGQPRIVIPGRRFIKEGALMKVSRSGNQGQERMFFLFNDMLMYCKPVSLACKAGMLECCCVLPIHYCTIERLLWGGTLFRLTCQNESFLLYTENQEEGDEWINAIRDAVDEYAENRQTLKKLGSGRHPLRRGAIKRNNDQSISKLAKYRNAAAAKTKKTSSVRNTGPRRYFSLRKKRMWIDVDDLSCPSTPEIRDSLYPMRKLCSPCKPLRSHQVKNERTESKRRPPVSTTQRFCAGLSPHVSSLMSPCKKKRKECLRDKTNSPLEYASPGQFSEMGDFEQSDFEVFRTPNILGTAGQVCREPQPARFEGTTSTKSLFPDEKRETKWHSVCTIL